MAIFRLTGARLSVKSPKTNLLRLLGLPKEIQDDIIENTLTMGHGKALLSIENKEAI